MRSAQRLACVVSSVTILGSAWACSSFEAVPAAEPDAAAPDAGEMAGPDAGFMCNRIGQPIEERFDEEPALRAEEASGGTLGVDGGVLYAKVTNKGSAQRSYYSTSIPIASGRSFGHARVRYTFKGLVPPTSYTEAGCAIIFHQRGDGTSSAVRVELRPESIRLDDVAFLDGGAFDSGVGEPLAPFERTPTDYPITIDVRMGDGVLVSTGSVPGAVPVTKTTPLLAEIVTIDLHCGIDSASVPDGGEYGVMLDDVLIDLCAR